MICYCKNLRVQRYRIGWRYLDALLPPEWDGGVHIPSTLGEVGTQVLKFCEGLKVV